MKKRADRRRREVPRMGGRRDAQNGQQVTFHKEKVGDNLQMTTWSFCVIEWNSVIYELRRSENRAEWGLRCQFDGCFLRDGPAIRRRSLTLTATP